MHTVEEKGFACISEFFTGNKQKLNQQQKRKKKPKDFTWAV
jgi:hypothetical protein